MKVKKFKSSCCRTRYLRRTGNLGNLPGRFPGDFRYVFDHPMRFETWEFSYLVESWKHLPKLGTPTKLQAAGDEFRIFGTLGGSEPRVGDSNVL
eukprot:CAMPEP_0184718432 /NCGR_PEP_ID=MMETSP0314-20130426/7629_1 /TAXON_ID=38298 /ORGANISM="Rhodella maculata, Strain CCMP 736" /LENGTH=93 /DNA_ID=CAMNT_0027182175 /DNA_START=639 /DNA_END=916 /DNA_ORIENTATION=+